MDRFLVCGLGSLGQHCVNILKKFGVRISAIDLKHPRYWDVEGLPEILEDLIVGDCRDPNILEKCHIQRYRCILLLTNDERVNIEAAFIARLKNPEIRLVLRSAQPNLNEHLSHQLDNLVAFEPTEISSAAFALAALGDETRGSFYINGKLVQIIERRIQKNDPFVSQSVANLNRHHRILAHCRKTDNFSKRFYQWHPEHTIKEGDHLLFFNLANNHRGLQNGAGRTNIGKEVLKRLDVPHKSLFFRIKQFFSNILSSMIKEKSYFALLRNQLWRIVFFCLSFVLVLLSIGSVLFYFYGPGLTLTDSIYAAVTLMLGGYFDLLGSDFKFDLPIPWWLRLFGLLQTITGTVLIGALYALITSHILATSFSFTSRPRFPQREHVIVIGWGRIGRRITGILSEFRQSFLVITKDEPQAPNHLPIISGVDDTAKALSKVNLDAAKAIVSVTNDEMINLELVLMAHRINPACRMVLRTYHHRLSSYVSSLFPYAHVLCSSALSAEAFAAAAFGENILNLFIQNGQTILVTQYVVEENDTLNGHMLAEIAYGYEVVPIVLIQHHTQKTIWMPLESVNLGIGDELTVLANIESLHRIEKGDMRLPAWQLILHRVNSDWAKSDGAMLIARDTGCSLEAARNLVENLPGSFPGQLFQHQGWRLLRKLRKMGFEADLELHADEK
ncbi:MAG: NAD-binding protein [Desulfobacterales bacterium]|jgi:Trk K+ transport system NAD-binding subunit